MFIRIQERRTEKWLRERDAKEVCRKYFARGACKREFVGETRARCARERVKNPGVRKGCKRGVQEREECRMRSAIKGGEAIGMCRNYEQKKVAGRGVAQGRGTK